MNSIIENIPLRTASDRPYEASPTASIDDALKRIFASPQEETILQKSRQIMGETVSDITDEELESYIKEFQHLLDYWLDNFERELFDGQTMLQVIGHG